MKRISIKVTEYGFTYQPEGDIGFRNFPDFVKSRTNIEDYLRSFYDKIELQFVNQTGQPAKLYTIKPGEKIAGERIATVDYEKKFIFEDITSDSEKLEYLRSRLPEDAEAEGLESDHDRVISYLQQADEALKADYKQMIADKLTPDVMREQCAKHAKGFNKFAEVMFEE
jgi:hypothetical protein